jgi:hypothetical protein
MSSSDSAFLRKALAAAVRALQVPHECGDAIERGSGFGCIPRPHGHERQDVHEVVVDGHAPARRDSLAGCRRARR